MPIKLDFEVGHTSKAIVKPRRFFTHEFKVYFKRNDVEKLMEQVIFTLHESFNNPERGKWRINQSVCVGVIYLNT